VPITLTIGEMIRRIRGVRHLLEAQTVQATSAKSDESSEKSQPRPHRSGLVGVLPQSHIKLQRNSMPLGVETFRLAR